jgi:RNA polymerase sigma-70 factor (ECF subfamily)
MPTSSSPGVPPPDGWDATLAAARRGCPEALGRLFEACRPLLTVTAAAACPCDLRSKADAADLVQDSLLEGQRDFAAFRGRRPDELLAWLRQVLAHNAANFRRRYRGSARRDVRREVPLPAAGPSAVPGDHLPAAADVPADAVCRQEEVDRLVQAITALPDESRVVVLWRHLDALPFDEIGRRLGRTPEAARQVWWRAVRRLRGLLEAAA